MSAGEQVSDVGPSPEPGMTSPPGLGSIPAGGRPALPSLTWPLLISIAVLMATAVAAISLGPAAISIADTMRTLAGHLPFVDFVPDVAPRQQSVIWEIRLPRIVLAALVGAMLAGGGAAYQGVLRNSLADPFLLGVAAGAGLGATGMIVSGIGGGSLLPVAAFAGALGAVGLTYLVSTVGAERGNSYAIILAGVAVAAMFSAVQTFLQQQHADQLRQVYSWILGSVASASWWHVGLVAPYIAVCSVVLLLHRRILDVLRVGGEEAATLGVHPGRAQLVILGAATLGTAAAVSVSGLIGFVGIVAPHAVRIAAHASYRVIMPVSMVVGAAFLIVADLAARTLLAPAEIPIGVVTAFVGGPFFLVVLRSRRANKGAL